MQLFHQNSNGTPPKQALLRRFRVAAALVFLVGAALAWVCPQPKPDAVLGRLDYGQFWLALLLSVTAWLVLIAQFLPPTSRRAFGFRAAVVLLSLVAAIAVAEVLSFFLPVRRPVDNPWYVFNRGGTSASVDLPFARPAHLLWEGLSRGDLATLSGRPDPYARRVRFETDMEGFRNSQDLQQADFVTIGDSFTEAGNVMEEETFTVLAGEQLGLSARNLGRAGYTAATELIVLKKYGLKCRPKVIVWQVAGSNDLAEMLSYKKWISRGRQKYFNTQPESPRLEAWQRRSPTFRLFLALTETSPDPWPLGGVFQDQDGFDHEVQFQWAPGFQPPARTHAAWPAFSQALLQGARICRTNQIRLLVLLLPMKARVLGPYTRLRGSATNDFFGSSGDSLGTVLKGFCASHEIPFVDATSALQAQAKLGKLVYLPLDTHLSAMGHKVVAELIANRLSLTN